MPVDKQQDAAAQASRRRAHMTRAQSEPSYTMTDKIGLVRAACALRLPAYQSRTLIILITLINSQSGTAYPSSRLLAGLVGIDLRNLARAVTGLRDRKLLVIAEAGTARRSTRFCIDAEALMAACDVSTDVAATSLQTAQRRLYGRQSDVSTDVAATSLGTTEGQLKNKRTTSERQLKLSPAPRSAPANAARPRAYANGRAPKQPKNAWLSKYKKPALMAAD